jgi:hypothetical protein
VTGPREPRDVVIDLGEDRGAAPADARDPRPVRERPLVAWLRRWRFAGLGLVLLAAYATGGAAPLPGPPLRLVARLSVADGSSVMVDGDLLLVLGDGPAVTAYSARTGARAWRASVSLPAAASTMTASEGVVLVTRDEDTPVYDNSEAIDEATGRILWRSRSAVYLALAGTGAVLMQPPNSLVVELADVHTGVPRWSMPTGGCQFTLDRAEVPPAPHAFALLCGGGRLDLVRLPNGEVTSRQLPPGADGRPSEPLQVVTIGPVLVVARSDGGAAAAVEAYQWRDGALLWTRSGLGREDVLFPCGEDVCVDHDGLATALDLGTGADLPGPTLRFPSCCDADVPPGAGAASTVLLVPPGRVAPPPRRATVVVPAQPASTGQFLQAYVSGYPYASVTTPTSPTLVEVVGRDGRVRPLQMLRHVVASVCVAITTYLICPTAPGQVSVWRYPTN